jgi:hypothetical protein
MAADDVVAIWRAARAATDETLANGALGRAVTLTTLSERPLSAIVTLLVTDLLAHAPRTSLTPSATTRASMPT